MVTSQEEQAIINELADTRGFAEMIPEAKSIAQLMSIRLRVVRATMEAMQYKKEHGGLNSEEKKIFKEVCRDYDLMIENQPVPHNEEEAHPDTVRWLRERVHLLPKMTRYWLKERGLDLG